ncbi:hypothetical protein B9H04_08985 [Halorubrum ezzemoulense DSM 17463]|uniref:Uncharacterized protein n=1 Tax=Halorubrum ezzemoulense DSM 17463 TaxID=1121945 RepID=A0A1X4H2Z8_HALEZ|nr:hypothetical protein [Halorubrum ezzemoulense]OSP05564.1 hypothetical protein B9H04_08985 [Halorubrum ezzemoulense DSM 17463]
MSDETEAGTLAGGVRRAARESRLGRLSRRTADAVRDSYLYRWLTAEPDPDVIVIDLRETWTVGPFIRLLDAVLDRLLPALDDSRLAAAVRAGVRQTLAAPAVAVGLALLAAGLALGLASVAAGTLGTTRLVVAGGLVAAGVLATRERRSWAALRETRPVELLVAALEPPEPPEGATADANATETGREHRSMDEDANAGDPDGTEPSEPDSSVDGRTRSGR